MVDFLKFMDKLLDYGAGWIALLGLFLAGWNFFPGLLLSLAIVVALVVLVAGLFLLGAFIRRFVLGSGGAAPPAGRSSGAPGF